MRISIVFILALLMSFLSCNLVKEKTIEITNPLDINRLNDILEIDYTDLTTLIGEPSEGRHYVFVDEGDTLISQEIDNDLDGKTDQFLVEVSLDANETKKLSVIECDKVPDFQKKTNIRFAAHKDFNTELMTSTRVQTTETEVTSKVILMEGPAWENDKVGFRNYFDLRNGIDIFGKLTDEMVLDDVGVNQYTKGAPDELYGKSYHDKDSWGMDILKVGNSLGAGAIALVVDDSLYRIGDNGNGTFRLLYEGPLRSEFIFSFPDWQANGETYSIDHNISITAGSYAYKSRLILHNETNDVAFATGIVNLHSEELFTEKVSDKSILFYTHDIQAMDESCLTMGIVMPKKEFSKKGHCREEGDGITQTFSLILSNKTGEAAEFWFYALWAGANKKFTDIENGLKEIKTDVLKRENPIQLKKD